MSFETLLTAVDDGVMTITLNRPDRLNAFTGTMMSELIAAFDAADADDAVRAVIVTGAGRAFCAGAPTAPTSPARGAPTAASTGRTRACVTAAAASCCASSNA